MVRDNDARMSIPTSTSPKGYDALMRRCWQSDPDFRPLIDIVREDLQNMMREAAHEASKTKEFLSSRQHNRSQQNAAKTRERNERKARIEKLMQTDSVETKETADSVHIELTNISGSSTETGPQQCSEEEKTRDTDDNQGNIQEESQIVH